MKKTFVIVSALLSFACVSLHAQEFESIEFGLTVSSSAGLSQYLVIGVREGATPAIDQLLQEFELPPLPPAEIFDARLMSTPGQSNLGSGSLRDYRAMPASDAKFTETYTIGYQAGQGATGVAFTWNTPLPSRVVKCMIEGVDIATMQEYTTQFAQGQITVELTMSNKPLVIKANPASLSLNVNNLNPLPQETVAIVCENDKDANWELTVDAGWLTVNPKKGIGDRDLTVAVNTPEMPVGTYNAAITVQARFSPVNVVIPVQVVVTVGVDDVPGADLFTLGQNYPNPFGTVNGNELPGTVIPLELRSGALPVSLIVYDLYGRAVTDLTGQIHPEPGIQSIRVSAAGLPPGAYYYKAVCGAQSCSRMMILMK